MPNYLLAPLIFLVGITIAGGIYKWVDEQGKTIYSDKRPAKEIVQEIPPPPKPSEEAVEKARQELQQYKLQQQQKKFVQELIQEQIRQANRNLPQQVFGSIALVFSRSSTSVSLPSPSPPVKLTAIIENLDEQFRFKINLPDSSLKWRGRDKPRKYTSFLDLHNFSFPLLPGRYRIIGLEVYSESLADSTFTLPTQGPQFIVPENNCVYIGRTTYVYSRLPAGPIVGSKLLLKKMEKDSGKDYSMLYLKKGALVGVSYKVDIPTKQNKRNYYVRIRLSKYESLTQARERNCAIELAKF